MEKDRQPVTRAVDLFAPSSRFVSSASLYADCTAGVFYSGGTGGSASSSSSQSCCRSISILHNCPRPTSRGQECG